MIGYRTLLSKRLWEEVRELEEKAMQQEARIHELEEIVSKRTSEMVDYFKRLEARKAQVKELQDALEEYQEKFPNPDEGWGLCALVVNLREKGMSREEIAAYLYQMKDNGFPGISHSIIGALLHPRGDIKELSQYGKDLLKRSKEPDVSPAN